MLFFKWNKHFRCFIHQLNSFSFHQSVFIYNFLSKKRYHVTFSLITTIFDISFAVYHSNSFCLKFLQHLQLYFFIVSLLYINFLPHLLPKFFRNVTISFYAYFSSWFTWASADLHPLWILHVKSVVISQIDLYATA